MKKLIAIASIAALAACSKPADETPAPADTAMAEATPAVDTGTAPGTYTETDATGAPAGTTTINADGTFETTDAKGTVTKGTYARKDGKDCFTTEGQSEEVCWTVTAPAADGSFTATNPDGSIVLTITPANATAAATPEATAT